MEPALDVDGRDIAINLLIPLNERDINLQAHAGFRKIVASIRAIGLIEPLSVFQEGDHYVILDGFLRYKACQQLELETLPCMVFKDKQGYSFNRNVNRLSAFQEMRMLRKSLESIDEPTIAQAFGMKSIRYRLAPALLKELHPDVVAAFKEDLITKPAAREFMRVTPERQKEMLREMKEAGDYSPSFCRALVLQTPASQRNGKAAFRPAWSDDGEKKKDLVSRLEHAEQQHDFYSGLYRQYSTDLMKLTFYVRKLISNPRVKQLLEEHQPAVLDQFKRIIFEETA
jgi:ParB family chromosome partitioning protein